MKKIFAFILGSALLVTTSFAQAKMEQTKTVDKAQVLQKPAKKITEAPKLKADGTPDKRFKENKEVSPAVPLKKDGTPDKRFKENKKKEVVATTTEIKKP